MQSRQARIELKAAPGIPGFATGVALLALMIALQPAVAGDYALTFYSGKYSDDRLGAVLVSKPIDFEDSWFAAAALSRAYAFESPSHQWEIEGQLGKHYRGQTHWEINALAIYRWQRFPWQHRLRTTVAIGDGLSFATRLPPLEEASDTNVGATHMLNYILVEFTFAPPRSADWSLVVRVHHRSGVYGLFNGVQGGSNIIAAGLKWHFRGSGR
jgi:hypothetical protein